MATKKNVMKSIEECLRDFYLLTPSQLEFIYFKVEKEGIKLNAFEKDIVGLLEHLGLEALEFAANEIDRLKDVLKKKLANNDEKKS